MYDFLTALPLLLIVNAYLLLALALLGLSLRSLVHKYSPRAVSRPTRSLKALVAIPLMLSCLGVLALGLFAIGISHGSRPEGYQVALFIIGCLLPILLLIIWIIGNRWLDSLWTMLVAALFGYLIAINPAIYLQFWAEADAGWAQASMARHYEAGSGGLRQSDATARRWYQRAALNGNLAAQYQLAISSTQHGESLKWYRLAAEQSHIGAMLHLARTETSDAQRQHWLELATAQRHREALLISSRQLMRSDLNAARNLLLDAADGGSRTAMLALANEYRQGGLLFDQDETLADQWLSALRNSAASEFEPVELTPDYIEQSLAQAQIIGNNIRTGDPTTLYQQATQFLNATADPQIQQRAKQYLARAAEQGHVESALQLARLAQADNPVSSIHPEAQKWYALAADHDNLPALTLMARYLKDKENPSTDELQRSLQYNERLVTLMQQENNPKQRLSIQHWSGEYRDTEKQLARMERLGGSWQSAIEQSQKDPQKEYQLASELLKDRQYDAGMQHMRSAAARGHHQAQFELAQRVLGGPRSYSDEIAAVSTLQKLAQQGLPVANLNLGSLYQSGTGMVPRNYYLSRQLLQRASEDAGLANSAQRWLSRVPAWLDTLTLNPATEPRSQIDAWYQQMRLQVIDTDALEQQYLSLLDHYRDLDALADSVDHSESHQAYLRAQTLQSHDLAEAIIWLERAADSGHTEAQYELAVRMIRGKKNSPEQQQRLQRILRSAADQSHVAAQIFLANQHKNGTSGFEHNRALAADYYRKALQHNPAEELLYKGRIAGREIKISRSAIQQSLNALNQ